MLGAKGVVLDILNDEEVCVLVSGLNEVMTFPVKHLKPVRPKNPNQRVKVVQGDLKVCSFSIILLWFVQ